MFVVAFDEQVFVYDKDFEKKFTFHNNDEVKDVKFI
jgi:hypothetical protein